MLIRIIVTDTGPGIGPEDHEKIFESFGQSSAGSRAVEGTGLGLTITKKFAELMGGEIRLMSAPGEGASFDVHFYAEPGQDSGQSEESKKVKRVAKGQKNLHHLIVDDNINNRLVLRSLLEDLGFTVTEAASGMECLERIENIRPDLIWMDVRMEGMDGFETTRQIRSFENERLSYSPVIVALTASVLTEDRQMALDAGCDDFMMKPFMEDKVIDLTGSLTGVIFEEVELVVKEDDDESYSEESAGESKRILLIEDEPANQQLFQFHLNEMGHFTDIAGSGEEAIKLFSKNIVETGRSYDFIFLDIELPGMNGYETAEQIRILEQKKEVNQKHPIIALSAHSYDELDAIELKRLGISRSIGKPFKRSDLRSVLEKNET